jgi:tryptophan synthase alpha chain
VSRLREAFARARSEQRAALVIYLCAGDPDLDTTVELMAACAEAGADVIELGMPFSDPTADGPVIQRASERALKSGATLRGVFAAARKLRARSDVGLVLFGYYNPLLAFGEEAAAAAAREAGVDGFLVVDLPPEEAGSFLPALSAQGIDFVPLIAPTTPAERIARIAGTAGSFLYYVSLTGVTGASADLPRASVRAAALREQTGMPVALGFGVKTPDDARVVAKYADGVVVGAAVCSAIERAATPQQAVIDVRALVRSLRAACVRE